MEVFSLKDDYGDIFITQSDGESQENEENLSIIGDLRDFSSPCVLLASRNKPAEYSDISDDDTLLKYSLLRNIVYHQRKRGNYNMLLSN